MRWFLIIIGCLVLTSMSSTARAQVVTSNVVGYDPLFWKEKLHLSNDQCLRLRDINAEFYKSLVIVANDRQKHDIDKTTILELLNNRSEKILGVFSYRQRKKWDKIADIYKGNIVASASFLHPSSWASN